MNPEDEVPDSPARIKPEVRIKAKYLAVNHIGTIVTAWVDDKTCITGKVQNFLVTSHHHMGGPTEQIDQPVLHIEFEGVVPNYAHVYGERWTDRMFRIDLNDDILVQAVGVSTEGA